MTVFHNATWKTSSFDHHLKEIHEEEEKIKSKNFEGNLIPGFVDLNLIQNSFKDVDSDGQISGNNRTIYFQIVLPINVV